MTQFFVRLPSDGDTMILDLDLDTTTAAAVKAIVDARLESAWRVSGVRILRSDLPFCGITLNNQCRILAMDEVLSSCMYGEDMTLYAEWPQKSEKHERRKRYGKGWDTKPALERRVKVEKGEKCAVKRTLRESDREETPESVENTTKPATETGGNEEASSACVSDDRPGYETEVGAEEDHADLGGEGTQRLSESAANEAHEEEQNDQQAGVEGREDGPTEGAEGDDPFADEDDNKENREPEPSVPVMENQMDDSQAEEVSGFDESNGGLGVDLLEEVF